MALSWNQPTTQSGTSSSVDVVVPPGLLNTDLVVVFCLAFQAAPASWVAPDQSWVKWVDEPITLSGNTLMLSVFSKLASGEPAVWTFTTSATATFAAAVVIFDDGGSSADIDKVKWATQVGGASFPAPALTPTLTADPYALSIGC